MATANDNSTQLQRRKHNWLWAVSMALAALCMICTMGAALVVIPAISPATGATVADMLRTMLGPQPVAILESISLQAQDVINRVRYQVTGGQLQMTWADTEQAQVADVLPATGWQAFGSSLSGAPVMAWASLNPDPGRPYAQVALIRIDLLQTQLHIVPGTVEPVAAEGVPTFLRPGMIPANELSGGNLLAAFNGGFKAIHGGYGMMVNGITILPPKDGIATVALYRDNSVRIGAWGREITATSDLIAYRQNCPLLVDAGQINPSVTNSRSEEWGYTVSNLITMFDQLHLGFAYREGEWGGYTVHNSVATWRSGLGVSRDGRFLIYAVGDSLTVESLARALQEAGAYYAMQLDIHRYYTRFVTFEPVRNPSGYPVAAVKLLDQMESDATQFLAPYTRDFFYVTAAPARSTSASARGGSLP
jgi:hypothetical protein